MFKYLVGLLSILLCAQVYANQCLQDQVKLQVLGSGGPELDDGRVSSGYLIWVNNQAQLMVDVGAGTSFMYGQSGAKLEDLQGILLTHLHVDHSADLPAMIKGSYFTKRATNLPIYGPAANNLMPATSHFVQRLMGEKGAFAYLKDYLVKRKSADYKIFAVDVPLVQSQISEYEIGQGILAKATYVHHGPVAALGWRVEVAGCAIVFSGDMSNQFSILSTLAKDADILVAHNAVPDNATGVALNLHMTPSKIAQIAKQAKVKKLVLSHFMKRTLGIQPQTTAIIRQQYRGPIVLATDGLVVEL